MWTGNGRIGLLTLEVAQLRHLVPCFQTPGAWPGSGPLEEDLQAAGARGEGHGAGQRLALGRGDLHLVGLPAGVGRGGKCKAITSAVRVSLASWPFR